MKDEEHKIQCQLFEWLRLAHKEVYDHAFAIPNGGQRHVRVAAKLKREGVKAGVCDIFIALPKKGLHGLFIELKAGKNKPTQSQIEWLDRLGNQGYGAVVCHGFNAAKETIEGYING